MMMASQKVRRWTSCDEIRGADPTKPGGIFHPSTPCQPRAVASLRTVPNLRRRRFRVPTQYDARTMERWL